MIFIEVNNAFAYSLEATEGSLAGYLGQSLAMPGNGTQRTEPPFFL